MKLSYAERINEEIIRPLYPASPGRDTKGRFEPKRYKRGDCLMCHKGTSEPHPDWPDGLCPLCGGTGRYPEAIMKRQPGDDLPDLFKGVDK